MTASTTTLNPGSGGDKVLTDSLTTVDGSAAPTGAVVQFVKLGIGAAGTLTSVGLTNPVPTVPGTGATWSVTQSGTWNIGSVSTLPAITIAASQTIAVTNSGTFAVQAAQSGTWNIGSITSLPSIPAGSAVIGKVSIDQTTPGSTNLVSAAQSGTWNIGSITTLPALPTGSNTIGAVKVTDGTNTAAVKPSNTSPSNTDPALVVSISPLSSLNQGSPGASVNAWPVKLADGGVTSAIKSGSTPATAADSALVVSFAGANSATKIGDGTNNVQIGSVSKGLSIKGAPITSTSGSIAAASTGTVGPVAVDECGNVTFTIKNTTAASPYAGSPVVVFEQSDDGVSWGPLLVTRADTFAVVSTVTLSANTANGSLMFDAALEGVNWVRARCTTGPTTNAMTIVISPGTLPFTPYVSVVQQPITKAVQGTSGVTTQDLKDAGRVLVAITCYQAAGIITTEALFAAATFSRSADGAAATTGQQFSVTSGKRFRIQSIEASIKNTAAAAGTSKLVLRYSGSGGTITNTSPILAIWDIGSNSATANNYIGPTYLTLPDGLELLPGSSFGFTNLSSAATMLHTINIHGFEY